jgi:hypothetical protein
MVGQRVGGDRVGGLRQGSDQALAQADGDGPVPDITSHLAEQPPGLLGSGKDAVSSVTIVVMVPSGGRCAPSLGHPDGCRRVPDLYRGGSASVLAAAAEER